VPSSGSSLTEAEKREKKVLEKKLSEMEEELKVSKNELLVEKKPKNL